MEIAGRRLAESRARNNEDSWSCFKFKNKYYPQFPLWQLAPTVVQEEFRHKRHTNRAS